MRYLLDMDTCIYIINQSPEAVFRKAATLEPGDVGISSVTFHELAFGIAKSQKAKSNRTKLEGFISQIEVLPFDQAAADKSAQIRLQLQQAGTPIGSYDLLIAGHALSLNLTLVSNNLREFSRVQELELENWLEP